jgi:putative ABC transport system permease protein
MKLSYIIFLSLKNLKSHKLRTFLTAGGVAISVGFVVFLLSLGLGLQKISTQQVADLDALKILDVAVVKSKIIRINDETIDKFKTLSDVSIVQTFVSAPAKISMSDTTSEAVVYGKNYEFINLEDLKLSQGKIYSENDGKVALVNRTLANQIFNGEVLGKEISLDLLIRAELLGSQQSKKMQEKVVIVGVVDDSGSAFAYVPLEIFRQNGVVNYTGSKVRVEKKESVDNVKLQLENLGYKVSSVKETVDQINQFFGIFQIVLMSFGFIAVLVACLGMFNTLTISLLEKTREVGFMKALGTTRKDIYKLFICESILIGALGGFVGVVTGAGLGTLLNITISRLATATGNKSVNIFYTPIYLIILVVFASLIISFLTGLYPSRRAAKINPLDAIRYE